MKCQKCQNHGKCELELELSVNHKVVCHSFIGADEKKAERDEVNHPSHYTGKYECIEVMLEIFGPEWVKIFCTLNAFKYLWRCRQKHKTPDKCIEKACWYLNKRHDINQMPFKITNADIVRAMSTDELATVLRCPFGDDTDVCITKKDGTPDCRTCIKRFLETDFDIELIEKYRESEAVIEDAEK